MRKFFFLSSTRIFFCAATAVSVPAFGFSDVSTLFAPGVSLTSGWYDANKKSNQNVSTYDMNSCWAAASANMLQWWQDNYKASGNILPAGTPDGAGKGVTLGGVDYTYELEIYEVFLRDWENSAGATLAVGLPWYFTGQTHSDSGLAKPTGAGGYFKNEWHEISGVLGSDWLVRYGAWGTWNQASSPLQVFSEKVKGALTNGVGGVDILYGNTLHQLTLWGADFDAAGMVAAVYLTDSDDQVHELRRYVVSEDGIEVKINGYKNGNFLIASLDTLRAYAIPEPSAFGLFAGTLALAFCAARRRRRKKA